MDMRKRVTQCLQLLLGSQLIVAVFVIIVSLGH